MRMTPRELREYIDDMRINYLRLKKEIEATEFELEMCQCPNCSRHLRQELEDMRFAADEARNLPKALIALEEFLAEDESANGWKGEDRTIDF